MFLSNKKARFAKGRCEAGRILGLPDCWVCKPLWRFVEIGSQNLSDVPKGLAAVVN